MIPSFHPALLGPAILHHLKQGKAITQIRVIFTHGQLHRFFTADDAYSSKIRNLHPLEMTLGGGRDLEKKIDCRLFEVPWIIDIQTKAQKKAARVPFQVQVATLPAQTKMTAEEQQVFQAVFELFQPFHLQAVSEHRLSAAALRKPLPKVSLDLHHQAPVEDTEHV